MEDHKRKFIDFPLRELLELHHTINSIYGEGTFDGIIRDEVVGCLSAMK